MEENSEESKSLINRSRTKNSVFGMIFGIISKIVMLIFPFIIRTVIVKKLGDQFLGLSSLFTSIFTVLNIVELGFGSALVFSMYKPIAEGNKEEICALLNIYRKIYRIFGIIILILGLILCPFLKSFINGDIPSTINIYVLYGIYLAQTVFSYWFCSYKRSLLEAHQRFDIISIVNTIIFLVQYIYQIVVLFIFQNYYVYISVTPFVTIALNITLAIIADRRFPDFKATGKISEDTKNKLKKSIKGLFISKVTGVTRNALDSIILSALLGLTVVAIYNNYYTIIMTVTGFMVVIHNAMQASVGNSIAVESVDKNYSDFNKFNYMYMFISTVCTVCLATLFQPFMRIWMGEELTLPFLSAMLFVIYFYITKTGDMLSVYASAAGLWWEMRFSCIVEIIINLVFNLLLGYFFGINGIVSATIVSLFITNFLMNNIITFRHYFKNKKITNYYLKNFLYIIIVSVSAFVSLVICHYIPINNIFGLLLKGLVALAVSSSIYILTTFMSNDFKAAKNFIVNILKMNFKKINRKANIKNNKNAE